MAAELGQMATQAQTRWLERVRVNGKPDKSGAYEIDCEPQVLPDVCNWLFSDLGYSFGGLVVEEAAQWDLRYMFYGDREQGWVHVITHLSADRTRLPSVSALIHAADWHEREAEDLFGLTFEGHPRLGDFVLHNDTWDEDLNPMRRSFDGRKPAARRTLGHDWRPRQIVEETGAFLMPVGPIYSVVNGPVYFSLETVGEDVIRAQPRLFYTYRGVEKIAQGRPATDVLLLAERLSGTSAFAHSLAFCQAVERICGIEIPPRARSLRVFVAELERLRHHAAAVAGICESTGLAVATAQAGILEEDLLRISCVLTGHRYLFGLNTFGGLEIDLDDAVCRRAAVEIAQAADKLKTLHRMLRASSSFLDRLENVGNVTASDARDFGLVGPIARASGLFRDLRKVQPYTDYDRIDFEVPYEPEGDGYARLRLFFREAEQSARMISTIAQRLPAGPVRAPEISLQRGAALGWVEAPAGAALHWVALGEESVVQRYRVVTPSFTNWHGFRLAAENFAFQDFPIILATFALSVHENDR
jgi:formate hydrogenlyase subunit 5